ncbi:MAG: hypothetical protein U0587_20410 [Candidatus Binatia bacterium]
MAAPEETPVPTVPPYTPTPPPTASQSPATTPVKAEPGKPIGPAISFFGAVRADGNSVEPESVDSKGIPTYLSSGGSGFMLVVEAKPGLSGFQPARRLMAYEAGNPKSRPDLEIESSRDMGNGSAAVCDQTRPDIGGIPGIQPPSFAETQRISDAINDLSCRFETHVQPDDACTVDKSGDFAFMSKDSTTQYCMLVARAWGFPTGDTLLSVRVRDTQGNPGPVKQMRLRRPAEPPKPKQK